MFSFLRKRLALRRQVNACADNLIAKHGGEQAWHIAYGRMRDIDRNPAIHDFNCRVHYIIKKKLKMPSHVDSATRRLQDSQGQ